MNIERLLILMFVISVTVSLSHQIEKADNFVSRGFRLPNNTVPIHYDISLSTNIHRGDFVFDGRVRIKIKVLEDSDTITLHYRQLIIRNVNLLHVNGTILEQNVPFTMTHSLEFLDISSPTPLTIDEELIVEVSYTGILRDDGAGFFRTFYVNSETNERIWLASNQFVTTDARHAIPCYDEVKYRTTIRLQIEHHVSYHAVSNTIIEQQIISDDGYTTTIFATTPSMSINILAFTISNFANTSVINEFGVIMSTYAQPEAVSSGDTEFSLTFGREVFRYTDALFGAYTLPKLDQIAIPNLGWWDKNGWGMISYNESLVLQTENETTAFELRIAHHFTHNYFGNLVSPAWWTYLWMNEGFATLFERIIVDGINFSFSMYFEFMITARDNLMMRDVNGALVPLNEYVESPAEINFKAFYDFVTHDKVAFLLLMLFEVMQSTTFLKGTRYYLETHAYSSVEPEDLHTALQRAYDEDWPGNGADINQIMWSWENLRGYPVVTVSIEGDRLTLKQEGFRTPHDELYGIPIVYTTASSPEFYVPLHYFWFTTREIEISLSNSTVDWAEGDWIIINLRNHAYYITNYDDTLWNLIIEALTDDIENIHFEHRGLLFANFNLFIEYAHNVSSTIFLRLAQSLQTENEITVWNRAHRGLLRIANRLRGTELLEAHFSYLRNLFVPIYDRLLNDVDFNFELADLVRFWSCTSGIQECLDNALNEIFDAIERGEFVLESSMCPGFMTANEATLMHFWNAALESEDDRDELLTDLACSNDINFLFTYLNASLDLSNNLTRGQRGTIITKVYNANFVGFDLIKDFLLDNHEFIHSEIMDIGEYLANIAVFTNTGSEAQWVSDLSSLIPPTSTISADYIESIVARNLQWHQRNFDELQEFYNNL